MQLLDSENMLRVVFELEQSADLLSAHKLRAELTYSGETITSQEIDIAWNVAIDQQSAPTVILEHSARAHAVLEDAAELERISQQLIEADPNAFSGHWYRAQALELQERYSDALEAYRTARSRLRAPGFAEQGYADTSDAVYDRIRDLERRS